MSFADRLLSIFPPPRALRMFHSGISITDSGMYVVNLRPKGKELTLTSHGFYPLQQGVVTQGVIQEPEEVIATLKKLASEHQVRFCATTIPDEKAYVFKTTFDVVDGMPISDAVALKIQETVPINMHNALYDYTVIDTSGSRVEAVVRVVHEKVSQAYFSVFKHASIQPLLFKVESQAIADAIIPEKNIEPSILVHISETRTLFAIMFKRAVYFSTSLDYGLSVWRQSLQKELSIEAEKVDILLRGGSVEGVSHEHIIVGLTNVLSVVRDEVIKLEEYWRSRAEHEIPVNTVYVCGMPAAMVGLPKYMADSFGLPVVSANVWSNAFSLDSWVPKLQYADALPYAPAIGAALPHALHW